VNSLEQRGAENMARIFESIAPNEAAKLARNTIHGVAGDVRNEIKAGAPVGASGELKKAFKVKRRRMRFGVIVSDVVAMGRAFYWRFIEYGERPGVPANPFILRAVRRLESRLPRILRQQFTKKLVAAVNRAKRRAVK
jgi:HK97 gp10 family phage protein